MYCICACAQKQPHASQNGGNYVTNITNGHTKMSNGISNPTFMHTEINGQETMQKPVRKKAAPPPPTIFEQKETIELQQEAALAQLDEILEKEVAIAQLDDVLDNETIRINNRKLSAGTLSNMSAMASHSEDVVADVHCANVVTPVAHPKSLPFPTICSPPSNLDTDKNHSELVETCDDNTKGDEPTLPIISTNDIFIEPGSADPTEDNLKELSIDLSDENAPSKLDQDDISPKVYDPTTSNKPLEKVILTSEASDKGIEAVLNSPIVSGAQNSEEASSNVDDNISKIIPEDKEYSNNSKRPLVLILPKESSEKSNKKPPEKVILPTEASDKRMEAVLNVPSVPDTQNSEDVSRNSISKNIPDNLEKSQKPLVVTLPKESIKKSSNEPTVAPRFPNEGALKSVTLRHVQKQIKQIEPTDNQNASDDNLKVGSEEYKNFARSLDNKLKRTTIVPTFYVAPRKKVDIQPPQVVPNENIIKDSINQVDAKEKLKNFYAKKNATDDIEEKLPRTRSSKQVYYGSKSVDESLKDSKNLSNKQTVSENQNSQDVKPVSDNPKSSSNSGLEDHRSKMESVFNSIKLKKLEAHGEEHLKRRLSRSLGSGFSKDDDKTDHKQKMDDIFKNIRTMRKPSFKQEKSNDKIE